MMRNALLSFSLLAGVALFLGSSVPLHAQQRYPVYYPWRAPTLVQHQTPVVVPAPITPTKPETSSERIIPQPATVPTTVTPMPNAPSVNRPYYWNPDQARETVRFGIGANSPFVPMEDYYIHPHQPYFQWEDLNWTTERNWGWEWNR